MRRRAADPIAAIATASGRGAIGIVRMSGQALGPFVAALLGHAIEPRVATYLPFADAAGAAIDHGLALWFPAPRSATGEDVLELQAHGGPVVLQLLLSRCLEVAAGGDALRGGLPLLADLRLAEPGEFTERAFLNDKLDLAQAEAVADLIDASTEAAARSAGRSLAGAFSHEVGVLRDALIDLRILVEATLDFPEEEVDFLEKADARGRLRRIGEQLGEVLDRARQGVLLRDGIRIVIAGQPNVGKSSLLNALAGAELAIVTPIAGTTRDKISGTVQIEGVPVQVTDTAGLRESDDAVEQVGIARSWREIETADAVLWLHDLTRLDDPAHRRLDEAIERRLPDGLERSGRLVHVFNKADAAAAAVPLPEGGLRISAHTGEGVAALRRCLLELAGWQSQPEGVFIARTRHLEALRRTRVHVDEAERLADRHGAALDLLAEELRLAHDALGAITGAFSADDLLGEIFGRFCIGK